MFKRLLILAAAFSAASAPATVFAQDAAAPAPAVTVPAAAAQAPETAAPAKLIPLAANADAAQDLENILYLDLSTGRRVAIRLMPEWAPAHVERIKSLARSGFYDGVKFHRVIDGFMAQTGDPTGTGKGGSDLPDMKAEFNMFPHVRGTVAMARASGEDSANSQFFIVFYPRFRSTGNTPTSAG
jgi:peptidylprolyl isomerase